MARPKRCRRVCREPIISNFVPKDIESPQDVVLSVDEYEVIRLVDLEKLSHEECAKNMDISRTTVTEIYESAREKIAECLVHGKELVISGGNYCLCQGDLPHCMKKCMKSNIKLLKGENTMRVAVTYENGEIYGHFGHTQQFKIYDIEDGKIVKSEVVDTNGSGHGALAGFLSDAGVDTLICGGIGGGAQTALLCAGIKLYAGITGNADDAVAKLLEGELEHNPNANCNHHHGEHGHNCGNGGCGNHGCH
ncbi:MAG: DUF134 domain-containing protein [Clostridia bacterium]|nr:DUF134 domain-containing protein [Clostridia bacterium]